MMNRPRITLLGSHERRLREFLDGHPEGHERAAAVLFRRISSSVQNLPDSDRFLLIDVIPFDDKWVTGSSPTHVGFEMSHMRELFRRCEEEGLVFGFVHNHPSGGSNFSSIDEANEYTLLKALSNRNGPDVHFVAMLWANGSWNARVRNGQNPNYSIPVRHTLVIGEGLTLHGYTSAEVIADESIQARQAAAFGQPFVEMARSLRIGVIGAGGTGSPTLTLLARSGFGELISIDEDDLEHSNLNRVRGAGLDDVGKKKSHILQNFIDDLKLPIKVTAIASMIDEDPQALDALSTCDIIFGCTDDQIGREVLNQALYVYAQAYIDIGLGGEVIPDDQGHACLRYHYARISTILPEFGECLFCQGIISEGQIRHQYALRDNPELTLEEAQAKYLQGGAEQAPGVGPFTSAAADFAVANLYDLIRPFRKYPPEVRRDMYIIDFVKMEMSSHQKRESADCPYCQEKHYLLATQKHRLGRPYLGRNNVHL